MAVAAALAALAGGRVLSALQGEEIKSIPWRFGCLMGVACLAGASLAGQTPKTDLGDTGPLRRAQGVHMAVFGVFGAAVVSLAGLAAEDGAWLSGIRAFGFWYGTSLLCGALIGPALSWVLPAATVAPVIALDGDLANPQPWNWALAHPWQPTSYILPIILLCVGAAAWRFQVRPPISAAPRRPAAPS
jgi:hypothetical protein